MAENQEEGFLHIGDKVILFEDDANGYLGSSGFSTTQLGVRPRPLDEPSQLLWPQPLRRLLNALQKAQLKECRLLQQ